MSCDNGSYYHFGILNGIIYVLKLHGEILLDNIYLDLNFDGLPLTKSSGSQFWPILGFINNLPCSDPFIIGIFHGNIKPNNPNNFLRQLIEEFLQIRESGVTFNSKTYNVYISKIICDAPPKEFILCVKGHNSYNGCTKCVVEGEYMNHRMCYNNINCPLRQDNLFKNQFYEEF